MNAMTSGPQRSPYETSSGEPTGCVRLVVPLHAAADEDPMRVGTKARTLARLVRAGFAVPEGMVLTSDALARVMEAAGLGPGSSPDAVVAAPIPNDVEAAIRQLDAQFPDTAVAVRSSASGEDLPEASFAGLYETVLHVRGLEALRAAVRRVWASAVAVPASAGGGIGTRAQLPAIAVLVQRQLEPDVAGVAFTANPVTGNRDEVLVSAVPGLGDALVSGGADPDEWTVDSGSATATRVVDQALAEAQARGVAEMARRVEAALGGPQDVEWAMAGGRLHVLQSRPITVLPEPPDDDLPPGTWVKELERHPAPLTALGASIAAPAVADGLSTMFATWGAIVDRVEARAAGGEPYVRVIPFGGGRKPPPWWLLGVLARLAPPLRRRLRIARRVAHPHVFEGCIQRWETDWRPELRDAVSQLRSVDLAALDDQELEAHLDRTLDLLRRGLKLHFHLIPPYLVPVHQFVRLAESMLGWSESATLDLLAGTSPASSEPARALAELAARIAECPAACEAVARAGPGTDLERDLRTADPRLADGFAAWCDAYAFRCLNDDPGSPVLAEQPWLLNRLVRDALAAHASGTRSAVGPTVAQERTDRAHAAMTGLSRRDRDRFARALAAAQRSHPLREDNVLWTSSLPGGLVRLPALEAGRRLVARGELERPEDAVHLAADTLRAALVGPAPAGLRSQVLRARAERLWTSQHPGPPFGGPEPAPAPDIRALPGPARRLNAALLWTLAGGRQATAASPGAGLGGVAGHRARTRAWCASCGARPTSPDSGSATSLCARPPTRPGRSSSRPPERWLRITAGCFPTQRSRRGSTGCPRCSAAVSRLTRCTTATSSPSTERKGASSSSTVGRLRPAERGSAPGRAAR